MNLHAYADESYRRGSYLICAATVAVHERGAAQKEMRGLLAPRQRRLHFVDESDRRRRIILSAIATLETSTVIYVASDRSQSAARAAILGTMVPDLHRRGVNRLVLDSREGLDGKDRATIHRAVRLSRIDGFSYVHQHSASEPLLWVPDAVAWAWGRGGDWRRRCVDLDLITEVLDVDLP